MGNNSRSVRRGGPFGRADLPRFLTSDSAYNRFFVRTILIVRDPRDVQESYYLYAKARGFISKLTTVSEFVRDGRYGASAWIRHTESWLPSTPRVRAGQHIHVLRYEDLLREPTEQLRRLADLVGINM